MTPNLRTETEFEARLPFKLTYLQANLISLFIIGPMIVVLLVIGIGFRDSRLGLTVAGGLAGAALGIVIFLRPWIGTYVLAVTILTNISSVLTDQGLPGINKPLVALTFVSVMAAHFLRRRRPLRLKPVEWLMLGLGGVWFASYFVADDPYTTIEEITEIVKSFIILLVVVYSIDTEASWKRVIWLVIFSTAFLAMLGAYQVITGNFDQTFMGVAMVTPDVTQMRLAGSIGDPNFYGQVLAAVLPLALYRILNERSFWLKLAATAATFLIVFAILNTYSRGAFLAMVVTLILIAIERRIRLSLVVMIAMATVIMMQFLPEGYNQRIETLSIFTSEDTTVHADQSFQGRSSEMMSGLQMFTEHPLLGVGAGNYEANYQEYASRFGLEYRTEDRQAHSLFVEVAAETGLLGLMALGGLFVSLLFGFIWARRISKRIDKYSDWPVWITSLQMSLTSYLITSIFLHGDFIRYLLFLVALGAAAIHISDRLAESTPPQPLVIQGSTG